VWSFGVVLWEIYSKGAVPYSSMTNKEVADAVLQGTRLQPAECCPTEVYNLMQRNVCN
jgi:hypothetical protein